MSQYRAYFAPGAVDPLGLRRFYANFVSKSFINGVPRVGTIPSDRPGLFKTLGSVGGYAFAQNGQLPTSTYGYFGDLGGDLGDWGGDQVYRAASMAVFLAFWKLKLGASPDLSTPTGRLEFHTLFAKHLAAFKEDPKSDAKDGEYRLYTKVRISFSCCKGKISDLRGRTDKDGGNELPFIFGTIKLEPEQPKGKLIDQSTVEIQWRGSGHPNDLAEPGHQLIAQRSSTNIWHRPTVRLSCNGNEGKYQILSFEGSKFPSRRIWVNGALKEDIDQGAFGDLWNSQQGEASFVE